MGVTDCLSLSAGEMQLKRAKQATKSAILMNLESRVCYCLCLVIAT